jgi:hypothetical protein
MTNDQQPLDACHDSLSQLQSLGGAAVAKSFLKESKMQLTLSQKTLIWQ